MTYTPEQLEMDDWEKLALLALKQLHMAEVVNQLGLSSLVRLMTRDDDPLALPITELGNEQEQEQLARAIEKLESTLSSEARPLLTFVLSKTLVHSFGAAAPVLQKCRDKMKAYVESAAYRREFAAVYFADNLWSEDPTIRTGDMVEAVRDHLLEQRFRPPSARTIRGWLTCVKPDEAQRPGRSRKSGKSNDDNIFDRA